MLEKDEFGLTNCLMACEGTIFTYVIPVHKMNKAIHEIEKAIFANLFF